MSNLKATFPCEQSGKTPEIDLGPAVGLLSTAAPRLSAHRALALASEHYGITGPIKALTGERDLNFLVALPGGANGVLKVVNPAEPLEETSFQIEVLRHTAKKSICVPTPQHISALSGRDFLQVTDDSGAICRMRVYRYLEGRPLQRTVNSAAHRHALGRALAEFDLALADFQHPAAERDFLWNVMQLGKLAPLVCHVRDVELRRITGEFIAVFDAHIHAALACLRHQVIHNDLSQSNYLVSVSDENRIAGILDFGDMAYAPLICDLGIAASYQIAGANDPVAALDEVVEGFASALPLTPQENELVLDVVFARLVQRLVLTEWRAARFPENRDYILRHNPDAQRLALLLEPVWRGRSRHAGSAPAVIAS